MNTALLLIDIQKGLDEHPFYGDHRSNPKAENNCAILLNFFRKIGWPVYHVKHNSINPASPLHDSKPGNELKDEVKPLLCEKLFEKNVNSAFIGTNLHLELINNGIKNLIIAGLTAEHCISTSIRMASNLGFRVILPGDATASFSKYDEEGQLIPADLVQKITLANLKDEFAEIISTADLLTRLDKKQVV